MKNRFFTRLVKGLLIFPLLLFGLWLLKLVYFPGFEAKKAVAIIEAAEENIFDTILKNKQLIPQGHFHLVDDFVSQPEVNPPLCLTCHGTFPHSKEKKVRSLLNFHTGFISCSVCHARQEPGQSEITFMWVDRETGRIVSKVRGRYGKYTAKIFPVRLSDSGQPERIFRPISDKAAHQFLKLKDQFTHDQIAQAKIKLHANISDKPVFCSDCHKENGYLDFARLGFPKMRVAHLVSTEVVGLVNKYKTFYMPSKIDFGAEGSVE